MNTASHNQTGTTAHGPWNKGKLIGQKPPLKLQQVWAIRIRLQLADRTRDLALFNLAIDSKLRSCDLVRIRVADVAHAGGVLSRATVMQRKTGLPVRFELTEQTREAVQAWMTTKGLGKGDYLFPSRVGKSRHISTRHYARIVDSWVTLIGLGVFAVFFHRRAVVADVRKVIESPALLDLKRSERFRTLVPIANPERIAPLLSIAAQVASSTVARLEWRLRRGSTSRSRR